MDNKEEYKKVVVKAFDDIQQENSHLKHVNLLVAGKSGVGKSTLINTVFGEHLAKTGTGKPVTDKITLIEKDDFPVRIYDTVGFELPKPGFDLGALLKSPTGKDIQKLIKKVQGTETLEDDIHVVWYLIAGTSARIEQAEMDLINWMIERKLPVVITLTKSYDLSEAKTLKKEIEKLVPLVSGIDIVLAQKTDHLESFGVEALIEHTFKVLPEGLRASFVHSQEASLKLKHNEATKIVVASMAATFGTGFTPIPGPDAPLMVATQSGMMAKITSIYGVDVSKQQLETALASMLGVSGALITGKTLSSSIAKLIPGIGTLGGGLISGSVGMALTGSLGYAYMELMELVIKGKVDLSSVTPEVLTELLITLLPKYLPK